TGSLGDFQAGDGIGWDAPACVEAGESGDFYALDQYRDRIVRISPNGQLTHAYPIPRDPKDSNPTLRDFRVLDKQQLLYVVSRSGALRCISFDGTTKWSHAACDLAWDVTPDGCAYLLGSRSAKIAVLAPDGRPKSELTLQLGARLPAVDKPWFHALRI